MTMFYIICRWVVASVAEDNIVQIWQMALNLFDDDADEVAENDAACKTNILS